jgi:hypothetical protein
VLLLLVGSLILAVGFFFLPYPINIRIEPEPTPLRRYDDGAGHSPLLAELRVTNVSNRAVWYLGGCFGSPIINYQQLVDGKWESRASWISVNTTTSPDVWTPLKSRESITISVGPVSEAAAEMRVGLTFTTERFRPTKGHWIASPMAKLVKRGEDYFWEPIEGSLQEEQVLPLTTQRRR